MGRLYSGWLRLRLGGPWRFFVRMLLFAAGVTVVTLRYVLKHDGGSDRERTGDEEDPGRPEVLREAKRPPSSEEEGVWKRPRVQEEKEEEKEEEEEEEEEVEEEEEEKEEEVEEEEEEEEEDEEYRVEPTDEWYCGYDSTWDLEDQQDPPVRTSRTSRSRAMETPVCVYKFRRFEDAARDMQNYRHDYPFRPQRWGHAEPKGQPNLDFYLGRSPCVPDGVHIDEFHDGWYRDYETLEHVHTYIQWLFPLQEPGMNPEASPLTRAEIQDFCQNTIAKENLLKSYKLMLDFYGIDLCDEDTGQVQRAPNWTDRFDNLNKRTHNNLRITRILKCLATLGYPHYQEPLVHFFLEETLVHGELANVKDSVLNYFIFAVRDKKQRRKLLKFAYFNYDRRDEFVWCPKKIQMKWSGLAASKHMRDRDDMGGMGVHFHASDPRPTLDDGIQTKEEPSESAPVDE